ncbi:MAG: YlxR family protein [Clostridia bacterium]|nr:YlxR family protein [Clostridia bacterium]
MHIKFERKCVVCKKCKQQQDLLRVAKIEGNYYIDTKHKLGGRGAYICKEDACVKACVEKKMLNRAYKTNIDDSIYQMILNYNK